METVDEVDKILPELKNPDIGIRWDAVHSLRHIDYSLDGKLKNKMIGVLLRQLEDEDEYVRIAVIQSLRMIDYGEDEALRQKVSAIVEESEKKRQKEEINVGDLSIEITELKPEVGKVEEKVKPKTAEIIPSAKIEKPRFFIEPTFSLSEGRFVRILASNLGEICGKDAEKSLNELWNEERNIGGEKFLKVCRELGEPLLTTLLVLLEKDSKGIRNFSSKLISNIGEPVVLPLIEKLETDSLVLRKTVTGLLRQLLNPENKSKEAALMLLKTAETATNWSTRRATVSALRKLLKKTQWT